MDRIEIRELINQLNHHNHLYYNLNRPVISDQEYDKLYDKLLQLEKETGIIYPDSPTQNIGYTVVSELPKVKHDIPLLSLSKSKSIDGLKKFLNGKEGFLSLKKDGLTTKLEYEKTLKQAVTRGDGYTEGEDITHCLKVVKNVPQQIKFDGKLQVVGESIITYNDFERINNSLPDGIEKYKSARNLASGSVRQLDSSICAERNVKWFAFNILEIEGISFKKRSEQMKWLDDMGFETVAWSIVTEENLEETIEELRQYATKYQIPIDGLVLSYNDIEYGLSLGNTNKFPRHSISYKFEDQEYITKYRGVKLNTTRTGVTSLVATFDPIDIDGVTVSRATLHNYTFYKSLQLGIGDEIKIIRANMVIPKIEDNLTRSNTEKINMNCPTCGSVIEPRIIKEAEFLYCTNHNCEAKLLGKLSHFVSRQGMNIEGLSESTLAKFIELGWLKYLSDIYTLYQYKDKMMKLDGFGKRSVEKLLTAIENSKTVPFEKFINALGIPNVGLGTAKRLAKHYDTIFSLLNTNHQELLQIEDIGDTVANSIIEYISNQDNQEEINSLLSEQHGGIKIQYLSQQTQNTNSEIANKTFVVTGTFSKMKRKDIEKRIEELGGKVSGSVSKNTHMLFAGEKAGSKLDKAKNLGVTIITDEDVIAHMLK